MVTLAAVEDEEPVSDDDDVPENVHCRLLGAVSNLYKQKRVKAPVRKEASLKISEFHLTKVRPEDKNHEKIILSDLTRVLEKRAGHTKINEQIKSVRKKSRKLPKPLEKPQAERLQRSVGYDNLKKDLNRWDPVVYHQRVAEHITFPLKVPKMIMHKDPNDFLTTFKTPTELELQLAESLNSSELLKKEKEEEELESFTLNLQEIKEQRSAMARLRAQLSYKEAKAARQNKIKSKKFHRIQRKDKIKMQIKQFEELQKTDPEAALKKLEEIEKARIRERASLRHGSTGHWARNLAVRAKYNKEARIAISEQLAKSRELKQKLRTDSDNEDEVESTSEDENKTIQNDSSNSWLKAESTNEVEEFYSKYKDFEEEKKNETNTYNPNLLSTSEKLIGINNTPIPINAIESEIDNNHLKLQSNGFIVEELGLQRKNKNYDHFQVLNLSKINVACTDNFSNDVKKSKKKNSKEKSDVNSQASIMEVNFSVLRKTPLTIISKCRKNINGGFSKRKQVKHRLPLKSGSWSVTSIEENEIVDSKSKQKRSKNNVPSTNSFNSELSYQEIKRQPNFDDMFFEVEEKLNETVKTKVEELKTFVQYSPEDNGKNVNDLDNHITNDSSLEIKKRRIQVDIDEELDEISSNNMSKGLENNFTDTIERSKSLLESKAPFNNKNSVNIEPNNFFLAKPKHLASELPCSFKNVEDNLDEDDLDTESKKTEKSMTIHEAFACDDVDEEFKQEKEEDVKKSQVEDINLVLPGWGSWSGPNIESVPKHKKKRFILKFPKQMPRRDENKGNLVINEDKDEKIKPHLVTELPFPFSSVKDYEASIRAPIGKTWLPQTAHRKLIAPAVSTKLGAVIEPMTKDQLIKNKGELI